MRIARAVVVVSADVTASIDPSVASGGGSRNIGHGKCTATEQE